MSSEGQERRGSAVQLPELPKENHSPPLLRFLALSPLRGDAQSDLCFRFVVPTPVPSRYPSLKARVLDVSFGLCSISANKALHFPRGCVLASLRSVLL